MAASKPGKDAALWSPPQGMPLNIKPPAELPEVLQGKVDLIQWFNALFNGIVYEEPDPEAIAREILYQAWSAETFEDITKDNAPAKLQEMLPNFPGSSTGPIEFVKIYVTGSDYGEGAPVYMVCDTVDMEIRELSRWSTGATGLQNDILRSLWIGTWPLRGQIVRLKSKDKGGRHLIRLYPVDGV
jgi:hypothetical protein